MKFSKEIEELLFEPPKVGGGRTYDDSDFKVSRLIKDWRTMDKIDIGILGAPYDGTDFGLQGQKYGSDGIRMALMGHNTYEAGLDIDIQPLKLADFGNIFVHQNETIRTHQDIEKVVSEVIGKGVIPLIFGGDHGCSYPTIKALMNNISGKVGIINFDAHLDVRKIYDGFITSGTPFHRLVEEVDRNPLDMKNFVDIGINGWHATKEYHDFICDRGGRIISAREVHKRGIESVIEEALALACDGTDAIWLSFDIDGIDSASVVGCCSPSPGALTAAEALEAVWMISQNKKCMGMDILEVCPPADVRGATVEMAAYLASQFMGGVAKRLYNL